MQKALEFDYLDTRYSLMTDGFSKNEIYSDGPYEVLSVDSHIKIRFFSNSGVRNGKTVLAENNLTLVLPLQAVDELISLLERVRNPNSTANDQAEKEQANNDGNEGATFEIISEF